MLYLAIGAAVLWLGVSAYRRSPGVQRGRWRVGAGLLAVILLAAAGFLSVRGEPLVGLGVAAIAIVMALGARSERGPRPPPKTRSQALTAAEARSLLGLEDGAGPDEVRAAYTRLMRMAHPDKGGTAGLAAQLNAARDRLLENR